MCTDMLSLSTFAQLWDNPHAPETQWYIRPAGGDTFHIMNVKTNKGLNVYGPAKNNGLCACFPGAGALQRLHIIDECNLYFLGKHMHAYVVCLFIGLGPTRVCVHMRCAYVRRGEHYPVADARW